MKFITGHSLDKNVARVRYSENMEHKIFGAYIIQHLPGRKVCGLGVIKDRKEEAEIGYMILEAYQGRGLATEVNKELIRICRESLKQRKITAYTDSRNGSSIRVLEKSGMVQVQEMLQGPARVFKFEIR